MVFQDLEVTRNLKDYIKNYDGNLIFSSYLILKINELKLKNPFIFHHHFLDHSHRESHSSYSYKTTKDVKKFIYDGYTVIYSAIELALFLDYEEIYLIGVDANYSKSLEDRNIISHGKVDPTYQDAGERICFSIKSMVKEKEIKLFNSSKSSKLKFLNFKDEIDGKRLLIDSSFVKSMGTKIYSQIFIEFIVSKMNVKTINYMSGNYVINLLHYVWKADKKDIILAINNVPPISLNRNTMLLLHNIFYLFSRKRAFSKYTLYRFSFCI